VGDREPYYYTISWNEHSSLLPAASATKKDRSMGFVPGVFRVIGVTDGGRVSAHVDDHLGLPGDLTVVERPDPDGHLQVLDFRHSRCSNLLRFFFRNYGCVKSGPVWPA
jgi:hypothetical protein